LNPRSIERVRSFRTWEEPFNEAIYCLGTDNHMSLVCGTARHGLVRLWDMRQKDPVQGSILQNSVSAQIFTDQSLDIEPIFTQKQIFFLSIKDIILIILSFKAF
jgi:hypothetical protein